MIADDDIIDFDLDDLTGGLCSITRAQQGHGRFVRQSAGSGQFADVKIIVAPHPGINCYRFIWQASEGLPKAFMKAACLEGVKAALLRPLPDGRRIAFVQVTVVDGSWHDTDTDEKAMTIAAAIAVQDALSRAHLIPRDALPADRPASRQPSSGV